ncbi:unnamed protein product [Protopolystoma xenopodis]|uniref:Uncharacterized protein n=1 Tax=Protopolystoma xenopodis TaxID=117903 RepID=A0A3S4ZQK2_9PLAT|nr:unnamed protein product [Protopolystoma xenopodis]
MPAKRLGMYHVHDPTLEMMYTMDSRLGPIIASISDSYLPDSVILLDHYHLIRVTRGVMSYTLNQAFDNTYPPASLKKTPNS